MDIVDLSFLITIYLYIDTINELEISVVRIHIFLEFSGVCYILCVYDKVCLAVGTHLCYQQCVDNKL